MWLWFIQFLNWKRGGRRASFPLVEVSSGGDLKKSFGIGRDGRRSRASSTCSL
jgi:hypothetical protein